MTLDRVKNQMATKAANGNGGNSPAGSPQTALQVASKTVGAYMDRMKAQIALALPKHMTPDRMARVALTTIRQNPKLLSCTIESLMAAVMQAAQLGLEPGLLGHCYIIPYENKRAKTVEATFMIGYRGMIDLARRSGNIKSISVREVFENDTFNVTYGIEEKIEHTPWHCNGAEESGELRGCYMVAHFNDGGYYLHYLTWQEINAHRDSSKAYTYENGKKIYTGPWATDYIEMAKKTVVRAAWKWLPLSIEVARAVEADETAKSVIAEDMTEVPDDMPIIEGQAREVIEHDPNTGEVTQDQQQAG